MADSLRERESGLLFRFHVDAYNFDGPKSVHAVNNFCGTSPVDFLAEQKARLFFIEVKDGRFFDVDTDKLEERVCKVYAKLTDSVALTAVCADETLARFRKKGRLDSLKLLLFVGENATAEMKVIQLERVRKQISKKLARLSPKIEFLLDTYEEGFSAPLFSVER